MDRGICFVVQARPYACAFLLYPVPVRHPILSQYPTLIGRLPPDPSSPTHRCHTAMPLASIRMGLSLAKCLKAWYIFLTFKNVCRARHTQ